MKEHSSYLLNVAQSLMNCIEYVLITMLITMASGIYFKFKMTRMFYCLDETTLYLTTILHPSIINPFHCFLIIYCVHIYNICFRQYSILV